MALKSTIFKANVQIADIDHNYYADHALTLARHPSETDERMMVRLLAFAFHATQALRFGAGLSTDDEPDVWCKDLTGTIEQWIEVGLPDERRLRRACGRAQSVIVYAYGGHTVGLWWKQVGTLLSKQHNLSVYQLDAKHTRALAAQADRTMQFDCNLQDGVLTLSQSAQAQYDPLPIERQVLQRAERD